MFSVVESWDGFPQSSKVFTIKSEARAYLKQVAKECGANESHDEDLYWDDDDYSVRLFEHDENGESV